MLCYGVVRYSKFRCVCLQLKRSRPQSETFQFSEIIKAAGSNPGRNKILNLAFHNRLNACAERRQQSNLGQSADSCRFVELTLYAIRTARADEHANKNTVIFHNETM